MKDPQNKALPFRIHNLVNNLVNNLLNNSCYNRILSISVIKRINSKAGSKIRHRTKTVTNNQHSANPKTSPPTHSSPSTMIKEIFRTPAGHWDLNREKDYRLIGHSKLTLYLLNQPEHIRQPRRGSQNQKLKCSANPWGAMGPTPIGHGTPHHCDQQDRQLLNGINLRGGRRGMCVILDKSIP